MGIIVSGTTVIDTRRVSCNCFYGVYVVKEAHFFSGKISGEFNPFIADDKELIDMSLKFSSGDGVDIDYVAAHICLNIAAMRGCKEAIEYRKELASEMNHDEISKAQREARVLIQMIKSKSEN
jgi:uncharacterized protein